MLCRFCNLLALSILVTIPAHGEGGVIRNSLGMSLLRIEPGSFTMGQAEGSDWDERPVRAVAISKAFYMAAMEVTNAQYEQFDPGHRALRGSQGLSRSDDEAVIFVSWHDATRFCKWLSAREGKPYRLPTEAEWEYACRAGAATPFHTGEVLPEDFHKNQGDADRPQPVPLRAGVTPPNAWGLYDMHGNVEEWCQDWYGPYEAGDQTDPVGPSEGDFKVTRGGSHNTDVKFLRSANRLGALPEDRHWLIGFRVVMGDAPAGKPSPPVTVPQWARNVAQKPHDWSDGPDPEQTYFRGPLRYVKIPRGSEGPMYSKHNHDPGLAYCPNGDLLAVWYSCNREKGRELTILASRFRRGADEWAPAAPFWDAPDRNDHAPALWFDGEGTLYHFNGLSAGPAYRENLALIMRTSTNNGAAWSRARLINPERGISSQPVTTVFRARDGNIVLPSDAPWLRTGGATAFWMTHDSGETWTIAKGSAAGIHAGVAEVQNGRLLAFGRYGSPLDKTAQAMPMSISKDMGRTWSVSDSGFPPIAGGQRLVLMRLREGPLLLMSFTDSSRRKQPQGFLVRDAAGRQRRVYGMFAALSFDDGTTWPVKKLITAGGPARKLDGGGHTHEFIMDDTHAEPAGYLAATQTPDGVIHLISSALHYRFNLAWLKGPMQAQIPAPLPGE